MKLNATDHVICCRIGHKMYKSHVRLTKGDYVKVELSPDLSRGRIVWRVAP